MPKLPLPKWFTDFDSYESAVVAFKLTQVPGITAYDSYDVAVSKARVIRDAEREAKELAYDNWQAFMEWAIESHDRGVGAGWE